MNQLFTLIATAFLCIGCSSFDENSDAFNDELYFPPTTQTHWETQSLSSIGWNPSAVQPLNEFLRQTNTKSFIILYNGRIVVEEYFDGHTANSSWEWNSAGKTLVTATVGIAQQEGHLRVRDRVSQHLGSGWTSASLAQENLIEVRHLLAMTSGLSDERQLVTPSHLTYVADAGTRWAYHNVFQRLMDVVSEASNEDFGTYFNTKLRDKIGMEGYWENGLIFRIYHSNTRSMARFGLLALNTGKWENEQVVNASFFSESVSSSQDLNPSYGYLWWLNGKTRFMLPSGQTNYEGALIPNAPPDLFAAMGARDQRIYVVPSKKLVIVRMGNASNPLNPNFAVSGFDAALWERINALIN